MQEQLSSNAEQVQGIKMTPSEITNRMMYVINLCASGPAIQETQQEMNTIIYLASKGMCHLRDSEGGTFELEELLSAASLCGLLELSTILGDEPTCQPMFDNYFKSLPQDIKKAYQKHDEAYLIIYDVFEALRDAYQQNLDRVVFPKKTTEGLLEKSIKKNRTTH